MVSGSLTTVILTASAGLAALLIAGAWYSARRSGIQRDRTSDSDGSAALATFAGTVLAWLAAASVLSGIGVFAASPGEKIPWIALGIVIPVIAGLALLKVSPGFNRLVDNVGVPWLIGVQLYRVVGAVFLIGLAQNNLPPQFALPAGIGDIAVGLTAPVVAYLLYKKARGSAAAAVVWNVAGLLDLVLAVTMGFLTSPSFFQSLAFEAPNYAISRWPFVLIPVFAVPVSVLLHLLALKRLSTHELASGQTGPQSAQGPVGVS